MKLLETINLRDVSKEEFKKYSVRETARGILLDKDNKIGVIYISKYDVYQLIGGGIEEGESKEDGLKRECKEEAGVEIEIIFELGLIKEIIEENKTVQNSYCYISKVVGEKGEPDFTKMEKEYGFEIRWIEFDEFEKEVDRIKFHIPIGEYPYIRTKIILEEYKKFIKKNYH